MAGNVVTWEDVVEQESVEDSYVVLVKEQIVKKVDEALTEALEALQQNPQKNFRGWPCRKLRGAAKHSERGQAILEGYWHSLPCRPCYCIGTRARLQWPPLVFVSHFPLRANNTG